MRLFFGWWGRDAWEQVVFQRWNSGWILINCRTVILAITQYFMVSCGCTFILLPFIIKRSMRHIVVMFLFTFP